MGEPPPVTLPSGAVSAKKLTSVGVKYGTVKREKLLLHNRMKWRRLACWGMAGAQEFTNGAQAPSGHILAPPLDRLQIQQAHPELGRRDF